MGSPAVGALGSHGAQLGLMVEARGGHEGPWDASNGVNGFSAKLNGPRPHMAGTHHRKTEITVNNDMN